jgi:hypothetical protein
MALRRMEFYFNVGSGNKLYRQSQYFNSVYLIIAKTAGLIIVNQSYLLKCTLRETGLCVAIIYEHPVCFLCWILNNTET